VGKKVHHEEEHENAERWLLTYADLITLLLAVFVVLYSTAEQDTAKFKKVVSAMAQEFSPVDKLTIGPGNGMGNAKEFLLAKKGVMTDKPGDDGQQKGKERSEEQKAKEMFEGKSAAATDKPGDSKTATLEAVQKELLNEKELGKGISAKMTEQGLVISVEEKLLFDSGHTEFKPGATDVLARLAIQLKKVDNPIRINGHTDNVPIHTAMFPSNWHLSSARAIKTAEFLIVIEKMPMQRIHVAGYADNAPAADNKTAEGRAKNRRVELVLVKGEKSETPTKAPAEAPAHGETSARH